MASPHAHVRRHAAGTRRRRRRQAGQGMVEYGLILVLVSLVVVAALLAVGGQLSSLFNGATNALTGV